MVSWDVVLGLMAIVFALPFIFLGSRMKSIRQRARDEHNEVQHLRSMLQELEDHVRHDQELFLETLGVPFLLIRRSGRLVMANRKAGELLGIDTRTPMNLLRMLPENDLRSFVQQATEAREQVRAMIHINTPEGERIYRAKATPLNTRERHIGMVFLDMTEEHRTQIIRRDFVANASHELRTPLTLILGYLETLLDAPEAPADNALLQRSLGIMKRHADRMARLVEDMLMLSRVETPGTSYLKQEQFDLHQLASDVRQRLENAANEHQAHIELHISPAPFMMQGDSFYWSQVLFNLVENSLKNNPAPGLCVRVSASLAADGSRSICVEDNGIGIPQESLPFIFNRFYRADNTSKLKGTGLGLAIVKHAVEAHGGSIRAESECGVRTCFTISLPSANHESTRAHFPA